MKHNFPPALLLTLGLVPATACRHAAVETPHPVPVASIVFSSPQPGAVYAKGDTVRIRAVIVSTEELHGYLFFVGKAGENTPLHTEFIHDHNDTLAVEQEWVNTLATAAQLEAGITATLDHNGNTLTRKVAFAVR